MVDINQLNADCAFTIGSTHSICQDYAFASNDLDHAHVVVTDGCSSSPDTDIGTRLVARVASQLILKRRCDDTSCLHREATRLALDWARTIGLPDQAIDATLLTAEVKNQELAIGVSGDGVVMLQSRQGNIDVYSISFPNGFPLYPSYTHQPERLETWKSTSPSRKQVRQFRTSAPTGKLKLLSTTTSDQLTHTIRVAAEEYKFVALLSDGIHSFYKTHADVTSRRNISVAMEDVIADIVGFKSGHGGFVARRAKQFAKQAQITNLQHADDLAVGAIYLGS